MNEQDKEVYSLIFKTALKLLSDRHKIDFAIDMLRSIKDAAGKSEDESVYSKAWEMLKEYQNITIDQEERWRNLVDDASEYGKKGDTFKIKVIGSVISELERRARGVNDV